MSRIAGLVVLAVLMALVAAFPAGAQVPEPPKTPTVEGRGGSAATVDPLATQTAVEVLRSGGNAVDAAVAAAGVLGVTEPFSCGIGGGGFMVIYDAKRRKVDTIDSREAAPHGLAPNAFEQYTADFQAARVSGLSVGVPGTVRGWEAALKRYGTRSLRSLLRPGERIARKGFVVDQTFSDQVALNQAVFADFTSSRETYLTPEGTAPAVGSTHRNPDMAETYERIAKNPDRFYRGGIARDIARTVQQPPKTPESTRVVAPGSMTTRDLARYRAIQRKPTKVDYRGLEVYGMGPPSSGGSTVGEALNILEGFSPLGASDEEKLHRYLEASRLAYADRNEFVGDPDYVDVPLRGLLSDRFADERRSLIGDTALPVQEVPGDPWKYDHGHGPGGGKASPDDKGRSTTHLTVADRWGNVVSYTFTIEQIGGSGIVVPDRGFLLNNELTDFNFTLDPDGSTPANYPAGGKRPRSSMAPTIVFDHGRPAVALGSPGGATIITTVLQVLVNHLDFELGLPEAVAAPRASQRNSATTPAEQAFIDRYGDILQGTEPGHYGHTLGPAPAPGELGAVEAIRFLPDGRQQAVAEPTRRGGGSAMVVHPG
ncbi:MAG TPA: gamma-glutamyltransferase [Solirubrobacteraceae bacterium]|nr:gamma-glutamyltransferase [Solirubrobacteraceae bacterium]